MMNLPEKVEQEENLTLEFIGKIQEIDNSYKKSFSLYKEGIAKLNLQIDIVKNKILVQKEALVKDEQEVSTLESSVHHESYFLEKLNVKFTQRVDSLYELQHEYKTSMDASQYEKLLSQKEALLQELLSDIEEQELSVLNIELERINRVNLLLPKQNHLRKLQEELDQLESEKNYFESSQLNATPLLAKQEESSVELIETEVLEKGN